MKKVLLISIALFAFILTSNAQVSFGPKVGLNLANVYGDNMDDAEMKIGAQVGVAVDFAFSDAISLQTGLLFPQKGFKESEGDFTSTFNINYLDIPVHAVYGLDLGGNKLQFFVGPYVGVGLTGKAKLEMGDMEEEIDFQFVNDVTDADEDKYPVKRFDVGLDFGAGFMVSNFQIQAQYGLGMANLMPKYDGEDPEDKMSNGVINLSVTYFFGK